MERRRAARSASSTSTRTGGYRRLLRHRRPRRDPPGGSRGVRDDPRKDPRARRAKASSHGLRIDHPDGLADPAGYLERLRERGRRARSGSRRSSHPGEQLRDWPVAGTVGYEFLSDVRRSVRRPGRRGAARPSFAEVTGETRGFAEIALEAKLEQARGRRSRAELARLERLGLVRRRRCSRRRSRSLPVYRTYVEPASGPRRRRRPRGGRRGGHRRRTRRVHCCSRTAGIDPEFVTRFQQTSPAIAAKGVEDTAFYRYLRLLALNEVGGDPGPLRTGGGGFPRREPRARSTLSRGPALHPDPRHEASSGDTRARIGGAQRHRRGNGRSAFAIGTQIGDAAIGDAPPDASSICSSTRRSLGAWPISGERLDAYLEKALREAKQADVVERARSARRAGARSRSPPALSAMSSF